MKIFILLLFTISLNCFSKLAPDNYLWISTKNNNNEYITEKSFKSLLKKLNTFFSPMLSKKLVVTGDWKNGKVNAYAENSSNSWNIVIFGGLARHEYMLPEGLILSFCHELGHFVGGYPKYIHYSQQSWASSEGQADYYAATKCMKMFLLENKDIKFSNKTINTAKKKCSQVFEDKERYKICVRISVAGKYLGKILADINNIPMPQLSTPSNLEVESTNFNYYPPVQCRVDTYFQGALCYMDPYKPVSDYNPNKGYCSESNGFIIGNRPKCWYRNKYTY